MKAKAVFFIVCALFAGVVADGAFAQAGTEATGAAAGKASVFETFPSSLGVSFAVPEGFGLSWKRWFGKWAVEVTAGGAWDPSSTSDTIYWYSVSSALSRRLYAEDFSNWFSGGLYLVLYGGHGGSDGYEYMYDPDRDVYDNIRLGYSPYVFVGGGIGIETVFFKHFSQEIQFLYVGKFISDPGIGFGANFAFRYRY